MRSKKRVGVPGPRSGFGAGSASVRDNSKLRHTAEQHKDDVVIGIWQLRGVTMAVERKLENFYSNGSLSVQLSFSLIVDRDAENSTTLH